MMPIYPWYLELGIGTPPLPTGFNRPQGGSSDGGSNAVGLFYLPDGGGDYLESYPELAQVALVAYRTGGGEGTTAAAAMSDAIANLGEWIEYDPYESLSAVASMNASGEDDDWTASCEESKYIIRWAPTRSSRAKILERVYAEDDTFVDRQITWAGAEGITLGGIPTCIPRLPIDTLVDTDWIYDPAGIITLSTTAADGYSRIAEIVWSTAKRNVPFPEATP